MRLFHEYMENNFSTRDFRVDYNVAHDAQIAYFFLSCINLAFHLTFEQRLRILEVVRDANGNIDEIEDALLLMELNIINENSQLTIRDAIPGMPLFLNIPAMGVGDVRWLSNTVNEAFIAAEMGTTYHDRLTFIAAGSFVEAAGRMGHAARSPVLPSVPNTSSVRGMDSWRGTSGRTTFSPANPGPLRPEVANTFSGGTYTRTVLTQNTTMYRVHGGTAGQTGSFMSRTPQGGGLQSQLDLALNPSWGNTATQATRVTVPRGTVIFEGRAAPQIIRDSAGNQIGFLPGGGNQVYIPKVEAGWFH